MPKIYDEYKDKPLWKILDKLLEDLVENQDINITTDKDYVIGYLVKNLKNYE